jgi:hypothetical protein
MFSIIHYWYKSIEIVRLSNLKLLTLVTLKRTLETYRIMGKYFWWLFVFIFYSLVYAQNSYMYASLLTYGIFVLQFFTATACRPSMGLKNCAYFRSKTFLIFFYIFAFLIIGIPLIIIHKYFSFPLLYQHFLEIISFFFLAFALFFMLDTALHIGENLIYFFIKSCVRALFMLGINLPIFLILGLLLYTFILVLNPFICLILSILVMPLLYSFFMQL